jgi:hypothetical protein
MWCGGFGVPLTLNHRVGSSIPSQPTLDLHLLAMILFFRKVLNMVNQRLLQSYLGFG